MECRGCNTDEGIALFLNIAIFINYDNIYLFLDFRNIAISGILNCISIIKLYVEIY